MQRVKGESRIYERLSLDKNSFQLLGEVRCPWGWLPAEHSIWTGKGNSNRAVREGHEKALCYVAPTHTSACSVLLPRVDLDYTALHYATHPWSPTNISG